MDTFLTPTITLQQIQAFSNMQQAALFAYEPRYTNEIVYPSDNPAGIPLLDITKQATDIPEPFMIWGTIDRKRPMPGTYAFYTDDYRFDALYEDDPDLFDFSGCRTIIEPNFSVLYRMPPVVAAHQIYKKRFLARYFQEKGIRVIVDLNVAPNYAAANLLGVPKGWRIYANRATKGMNDTLYPAYELARAHAEGDITYLVYGGSKGGAVHRMCDRHGWLWFEDRMSTVRRMLYPKGRKKRPPRHEQQAELFPGFDPPSEDIPQRPQLGDALDIALQR